MSVKKFYVVLLVSIVMISFANVTHATNTFVWTEQTNSGANQWRSVASSSDGTMLAAVSDNGYIYTSTDSGVHWTPQTLSGSRQWTSITSSSNGMNLAATVFNGDIYTSTDAGVHWTDQTLSGAKQWSSVASSADGTKLIAAAGYYSKDYIYISTDSGVDWTQQSVPQYYWVSVASSADGNVLVAAPAYHTIYVSTDGGATWTAESNSTSENWAAVAVSTTNGSHIVAAVDEGDVFTSSDSGEDWTDQTGLGSKAWFSVAASADGSVYMAGVGWDYSGDIYVSPDAGSTWVDQTSAGSAQWSGLAMSSDGTKLVATNINSGYIYTSASVLAVSPVLTQVTPVDSQTTIADAVYHFTTSESCSPLVSTPTATRGSVAVHISNVVPSTNLIAYLTGMEVGGEYSFTFNCRDGNGDISNTLDVGPFTVINPPTASTHASVVLLYGCKDPKATNYNPNNGIAPQNSSCIYPSVSMPTAVATTNSNTSTFFTFTKNLKRGMDDPDVSQLQKFLDSHDFPVATAGWGSLDQLATTFGKNTVTALKLYQTSIGLPSTGYFGTMTRAYVNNVLAEGK